MSAFVLHQRLEADTVFLADWPLCRVLLMNEAQFPWLVLVPRKAALREIIDLEAPERAVLMEEMARASRALSAHCGCDKLNVAALGNQVPQLHIHVIARFEKDAAWPRPVWGTPHQPYDGAGLAQRVAELQKALG